MTNIMSCGCDTSQKYDIVAIPEWNPIHIYGPNETVKVNGVIYSSKGNFQHFINGVFPGMPQMPGHMEFNIGQNPVIIDNGLTRDINTKFWNTIPFTECFNSLTCTVALPSAAPAPAPSQILEASSTANTNLQNVLPAPNSVSDINLTDSLAPGPVTENIDNFYDDEEDDDDGGNFHTMPDGSKMKGSMFEAHILPNLPNIDLLTNFKLEDIDTKHIIIGLAGALTLILLFKK